MENISGISNTKLPITEPMTFMKLMQELIRNQELQTTILTRDRQQMIPGIERFRQLNPRYFTGKEDSLEAEEWACSMEDLLASAIILSDDWVKYVRLHLTHYARYG